MIGQRRVPECDLRLSFNQPKREAWHRTKRAGKLHSIPIGEANYLRSDWLEQIARVLLKRTRPPNKQQHNIRMPMKKTDLIHGAGTWIILSGRGNQYQFSKDQLLSYNMCSTNSDDNYLSNAESVPSVSDCLTRIGIFRHSEKLSKTELVLDEKQPYIILEQFSIEW